MLAVTTNEQTSNFVAQLDRQIGCTTNAHALFTKVETHTATSTFI